VLQRARQRALVSQLSFQRLAAAQLLQAERMEGRARSIGARLQRMLAGCRAS
jgi:hypothetical protein